MAREGKKIQHIHSNVPNKQPKANILEYGELAVNNAAGNEFISTKNSNDEVVRFSSDGKIVSVIEKKSIIPYEGKVIDVTENDLLNNQSQLLIKFNQVAAKETNKHDVVNGATDMHGDEINPSTDGGKTNGAGFAIDMSRYAMIDANPSFSSVTTNDISSNDGENLCITSDKETRISGSEKTVVGTDCSSNQTQELVMNGDSVIISGDTVKIIGLSEDSYNNNYVTDGNIESDGTITLKRKGLSYVSITGLSEFIGGVTDDNYVTNGNVNPTSGVITLNRQNGDVSVNGLSDFVGNKIGELDPIATNAEYTTSGATKVIVFKDKDGNVLSGLTIDATDFIKDGMVNNVSIEDVEVEGETVRCLVITFNTDAGKEDINIPISDIFDEGRLNNYYTKSEIDHSLGRWFSPINQNSSSVTDVLEELELVTSAAINDLDSRVIEISGDVKNIDERVTILENKDDIYVEEGNVDSNGLVTLTMSAGEDKYINGLASYIDGKIAASSADTYAVSGNVDSSNGEIKIRKNDGTDATVVGLKDFVDARANALNTDNFVTSGTINATSGLITLSRQNGNVDINGLATFVDGRVGALSGDTNDYVTGGSVDSGSGVITLKVKGQNDATVNGLSTYVDNRLNALDGIATSASVVTTGNDTKIVFKDKNGTELSGLTIDANKFVKDGMVMSVEIKDVEGVKSLVITWNNDSAPEVDPLVTVIPVTDIFDPAVLDDYYTKTQINNVLGNMFDASNPTSSVTDVIVENELVVSAALNDLNSRVIEVSGDVATNSTRISNLDGRVTVLEGKQDKYVASGSFDSGTVTLTMSDGTSVYITGISTGEGADGNDYVTGGTVNSDGTITLNIKGGDTATISGLSTYLTNNDKYVSGGSVDANSGAITLKLKNGNDVTLTGLSAYVSAHDTNDYVTGGTVNENTGAITLNTRSGGTASVSGLSNYLAKNDKHVSGGSVNSATGVINLSLSDGTTKSISGLSDYVSAHDSNSYVTAGTVDSGSGIITLSVKDIGNVTVDGLGAYLNGKISAVSGDTNDYVTGGTLNQTNGNIQLTLTGGKSPVNITGLSTYIDSKTSGFSTTDIQVNGGSVNSSDGVITLTRIDSKNTSATVPSISVSGLKAFVDSEITINDKYVSGGSINQTNGNITLGVSNGNQVTITGLSNYVDSKTDDYLPLSGGTITDTNHINFRDSSNYITTRVDPNDEHSDPDYQLVLEGQSGVITTNTLYPEGYPGIIMSESLITGNNAMVASPFGLRSDTKVWNTNGGITDLPNLSKGTTSGTGNAVTDINVSGHEITLVKGATFADDSNVVHKTGDETISGNKTFNNSVTLKNPIYINDSTTGHISLNATYRTLEVANNAGGSVVISPSVTSNSFIKSGGTATQVLLANGGVKELSEITPTDVWVNESGDTMTGNLVFNNGEADTIWLNATNGNISTIGNITATGSMFSSDKRLKENIHFLENEDLDKVKNIEFKSFNFISNKSSQKIGVIAQELQENGLGKLTSVNDGGYLAVDYISLLCLKIAQLEKEIEELKKNK